MEPTSRNDLPAKVEEEIRYKFVIGFDNCETIFWDVLRTHAKTLGLDLEQGVDEATEATLRSVIQAALTEKLDEMKSWPSPTDCDRLLAAFAALDEQGIVALEMPGFTLRDCYERAAELSVTRIPAQTTDEQLLGHAQFHEAPKGRRQLFPRGSRQ